MQVSGSVDRAEGRGGESDFSGEDSVMGGPHSPPSRSMSPPISPSPPTPPPPACPRWSDFGSLQRNVHGRGQTAAGVLSYREMENCPQCRERLAAFKRTNSIQSAATLNSYTGSLQTRKGNFLNFSRLVFVIFGFASFLSGQKSSALQTLFC